MLPETIIFFKILSLPTFKTNFVLRDNYLLTISFDVNFDTALSALLSNHVSSSLAD